MNPVTNGALKSKKTSKKPELKRSNSRFTQQELPAWKPILTPGWVITSFLAIAFLFIPIGLVSLFASERVVEIVYRYDQDCVPEMYRGNVSAYIRNSLTNKTCIGNITVPKKMDPPIFVYYQLDNFYQNHRRYVKSRSDKQLRSAAYESSTKECEPEARFNKSGDPVPIVPCGLIAWSLFNDTYNLIKKDKVLNINKKGIAWKSDTKVKFGSNVYPKNFQSNDLIGGGKLNESIPLSKQEDLIVWMRTAALPTFRKLYGKINTSLEAHDTITVVLENNYNTYSFGGQKKLVLSTTSWIGGKNDFLGIAYLTVGGICLFMALNFILLYVFKPRPLGDPSYLSWNRKAVN
ncbi:putative CDC50/LEM3 family protein [Helianthus annuus]|uniref:ALA-interacting subunit n=1 Tax=Helianthus annuus TaxID=4232 RepID=A0A9K3J5C6_HELAN|nr:putative CDC50/LEM3 family protein [Helianthus annuus]KAJ0580235.1 putative CDC50/LEM3 family protein [Helianthus annuus]KAJ0587705.1 putative CDC50/LEM3 family protein [Helianthus annuus]KAJ0596178.1 putative CDC50/LEM3 family protein [Helianthus annuus]KAJ0756829.1 putative CDC50/LEM3 family protein [Helianthus annuus]